MCSLTYILSNIFLDLSPQLREANKQTCNKQMGLYQTEKLQTRKITVNKTKRQPSERGTIFANNIYGKWLLFKINNKLIQYGVKILCEC